MPEPEAQMSDLSPEMQWQIHRVSTNAARFMRDQILEMFGGELPKSEDDPLRKTW
jgi:hypothetical protein